MIFLLTNTKNLQVISMIQAASQNEIYFETQKKLSNQCGVHALNNILGKPGAFSCQRLNDICKNLSSNFINPHKHIFGGDFDVNILMVALEQQGYECSWIDSRKHSEIFTQQNLNTRQCLGFLVNKQSSNSTISYIMKSAFGFSGRHWIAIKKIDKCYYLLDSKREKPQIVNNVSKFLAIQVQMGSHVIEVFPKSLNQAIQKQINND